MKCINCPYYWEDTKEVIGADRLPHLEVVGKAYCHYNYNDGYAPCEQDNCDYDESEVDNGEY